METNGEETREGKKLFGRKVALGHGPVWSVCVCVSVMGACQNHVLCGSQCADTKPSCQITGALAILTISQWQFRAREGESKTQV